MFEVDDRRPADECKINEVTKERRRGSEPQKVRPAGPVALHRQVSALVATHLGLFKRPDAHQLPAANGLLRKHMLLWHKEQNQYF